VGLAPDLVVATTEDHRGSLKNSPKTVTEYSQNLERQKLTQTSAEFRPHLSDEES
jgi:hypothetical protein